MRRFQNSSMADVAQKNHSGFTTEDIDDLYMPRQLDLFERKLKASHDLSDTSEQEEIRLRSKHRKHSRQSRSSKYASKRARQDQDATKIVINYRKTTQPDSVKTRTIITTTSPTVQHRQQQPQQSTSYLEEAKRKLEAMKSSKAYYYNLNNKLKSSVTNLVKASQDLARNSELKQKYFFYLCDIN